MEKLIKFLGIMVVAVGIALLVAFPTMWLWNELMPEIFGLIKISFWQALGLNLLASILFKSSSSSSS